MRRYQMWLAAGILVVGPTLTYAGPFSFKKSAPKPQTQSVIARGQNPNDDKAREVAKAIRSAKVGSKVKVAYQNGTAVVMGPVSSPQEAMAVIRAVDAVQGVSRIENKLEVPKGAQQAVAQGDRRTAALQQAGFQAEGEAPPAPAVEAAPMEPTPMGPPMGPRPAPAGGPAYGPAPMPSGMPSHHVYDQPNMPGYAWPSYAAYPNSAAVTYPQQYSASAWPYIGPFYPYPQVPLGWRKVQLEWDDGYWNLNFRPRTDRWWWFMDYRNW